MVEMGRKERKGDSGPYKGTTPWKLSKNTKNPTFSRLLPKRWYLERFGHRIRVS